jgi:hypothetical protein
MKVDLVGVDLEAVRVNSPSISAIRITLAGGMVLVIDKRGDDGVSITRQDGPITVVPSSRNRIDIL